MTEIKTIEGGQKDVLFRRANIKKTKKQSLKQVLTTLFSQIGVDGDYSGHHCSWCTSPEGVSIKLRSAIHQDFPRWGDFPEKLKLDFLSDVIENGNFF